MSQGGSRSWLIHTQSSYCPGFTVFHYLLIHLPWLLSFCCHVLGRSEGCHKPPDNCCDCDDSQKQTHWADHCIQSWRGPESNPNLQLDPKPVHRVLCSQTSTETDMSHLTGTSSLNQKISFTTSSKQIFSCKLMCSRWNQLCLFAH